jgi:ELWxxDGT repeat protein
VASDGEAVASEAPVSRLLFLVASASGQELWASDGTERGTAKLMTFYNPVGERPGIVNVSSRTYLVGGYGASQALWKSDSTTAGTVVLHDFGPVETPRYLTPKWNVRNLTAIGESLFFTFGDQIWKSDGTAVGTVQVDAAEPKLGHRLTGGNPDHLRVVNGQLLFVAQDTNAAGNRTDSWLWRSDGTDAGTFKLAPVPDFGSETTVTSTGTRAFFPNYWDLWQSDGTADGTGVVATSGDLGAAPIRQAIVVGDRLLFRVERHTGTEGFASNYSQELWRSDGTPDGTSEVKNLGQGFGSRGISTSLGPQAFFTAFEHDTQLWTSDGTTRGTRPVATLPASIGSLTAVGTQLFVSLMSGDPRVSDALWISDGRQAGTQALKTFGSGTLASPLGSAQGRLLFLVRNASSGGAPALWTSDGTEAGTALVLVLY